MTTEERLSKLLLKSKTQPHFRGALREFCTESQICEEWIDITKVFADNQVRWREKLVEELKDIIDDGYLSPGKDLSFSSDFTKFVVREFRKKVSP